MTKEDLYYDLVGVSGFEKCLDAFFSQNICIPKGTNRHEYADVYHAFAEGINIQHSFDNGTTWLDTEDSCGILRRIKPSEPVYEWQWLMFGKQEDTKNHCFGLGSEYYTEDEVADDIYNWVKIKETKRVRV